MDHQGGVVLQGMEQGGDGIGMIQFRQSPGSLDPDSWIRGSQRLDQGVHCALADRGQGMGCKSGQQAVLTGQQVDQEGAGLGEGLVDQAQDSGLPYQGMRVADPLEEGSPGPVVLEVGQSRQGPEPVVGIGIFSQLG